MSADPRENGFRQHVAEVPPVAASTRGPAEAASLAASDLVALGTTANSPALPTAIYNALQEASSPAALLKILLGPEWNGHARAVADRAVSILNRQIAQIDALLSQQVNAILHHPKFQQLESAWRGLRFLIDQAYDAQEHAAQHGEPPEIKIRVLSVTKRELALDIQGALEFDQSHIFRQVYEQEFDMPGGTPYGVLLGNYEFTNHPDDVDLLAKLSEVAAAAFAPFIAAPAPSLLGLEQFSDLQQPVSLAPRFQQPAYLKWNSLRDREDSRFLGLVLPRVLMRLPYAADSTEEYGFCFAEDVSGPGVERYLWGNSIYALGSVLIRSFADCGWFADIRGAERGLNAGGMVTGVPVHSFRTDAGHLAAKMSADVALQEDRDAELSELGFVSLCHCQDTAHLAFFANQSVQRPKSYSDNAATTNAKISSMLQYMLCCSRFAHYLKVILRQKVGDVTDAGKIEFLLNQWLTNYVTSDSWASPETKARLPLAEASVVVREVAAEPGTFRMEMYLRPHFQLDQLTVALKLATRIAPL